jgi:transcriptional regulator with XRE-family HTH domain
MSAHAVEKLLTAFGDVLASHRRERKLAVSALATATGLPETQITALERGDHEPTLTDFFRIAWALGEEPGNLFIDVISESRKNPNDLGLYKSRASAAWHGAVFHLQPASLPFAPPQDEQTLTQVRES